MKHWQIRVLSYVMQSHIIWQKCTTHVEEHSLSVLRVLISVTLHTITSLYSHICENLKSPWFSSYVVNVSAFKMFAQPEKG